jgi:hypothetical protein
MITLLIISSKEAYFPLNDIKQAARRNSRAAFVVLERKRSFFKVFQKFQIEIDNYGSGLPLTNKIKYLG